MLYDDDFYNKLVSIKSSWKKPLVSYIVSEATEEYKNLKILIEKWFSKISEDKKAEYSSRLRSLNDEIFIAQLFEFLVFEYCEAKYPLEIDPELDTGKTPEMIWHIHDDKVVLDVITIFNKKDDIKKEKTLNDLIDYLSDDVSTYSFGISVVDIDTSKLKKKLIKKKLMKQAELGEILVEFNIDDYGFEGEIEIIPKNEPSKTNFFVKSGVQEIEPLKSIEKRIKSKVNKYKWEGALVVAICKNADFGADIDDLKEVLYGTTSYFFDPESKKTKETLNQDGLYTKQVNGNFQFTSLSGVLYCELVWDLQPQIKVTYLENPNTKFSLHIRNNK